MIDIIDNEADNETKNRQAEDIDSKFNPRYEHKSFGEKDNADTITAGVVKVIN